MERGSDGGAANQDGSGCYDMTENREKLVELCGERGMMIGDT